MPPPQGGAFLPTLTNSSSWALLSLLPCIIPAHLHHSKATPLFPPGMESLPQGQSLFHTGSLKGVEGGSEIATQEGVSSASSVLAEPRSKRCGPRAGQECQSSVKPWQRGACQKTLLVCFPVCDIPVPANSWIAAATQTQHQPSKQNQAGETGRAWQKAGKENLPQITITGTTHKSVVFSLTR